MLSPLLLLSFICSMDQDKSRCRRSNRNHLHSSASSAFSYYYRLDKQKKTSVIRKDALGQRKEGARIRANLLIWYPKVEAYAHLPTKTTGRWVVWQAVANAALDNYEDLLVWVNKMSRSHQNGPKTSTSKEGLASVLSFVVVVFSFPLFCLPWLF